MRVMVFFDLPVETSEQRRRYSKFRKYLLTDGFIMMQKSVYSKIALNGAASEAVVKNVRKHSPKEGVIQVMTVTEKQFQCIEYIIGEAQKEIVDTQQRLVFL
jgi:CRISPR-associated protein Cas2